MNPNTTAQPTMAELQAQIAKLQEQLKNKNNRAITLKVSEKGAVSAYGLGRFPVTLYLSQWEKLMGEFENIKAFIAANRDKLTVKEAA